MFNYFSQSVRIFYKLLGVRNFPRSKFENLANKEDS